MKSYHTVLLTILTFSLVPTSTIIGYCYLSLSPTTTWEILSYALFSSIFSLLTIFITLMCYEKALKQRYNFQTLSQDTPGDDLLDEAALEQAHENQEALLKAEEEIRVLIEEIQAKDTEIEKIKEDKGHFHQRKEELLEEFAHVRHTLESKVKQQDILIQEYTQTIDDQRNIITKKQKQIDQFETKVHDLTYEIKTLLQLAETSKHSTSAMEFPTEEIQSEDSSEARLQLKRCINLAQKLTGATHFNGGHSRFPSYALDQRRLFESLQNESQSPLFVYSQKDKKLLFANKQVEQLLGWSPDKFIQSFEEITHDGLQEWKTQAFQLTPQKPQDMRLVMKARSGEEKLVHCQMGLVPSGLFRNHVIGILHAD